MSFSLWPVVGQHMRLGKSVQIFRLSASQIRGTGI
jgi:hypothetical protein